MRFYALLKRLTLFKSILKTCSGITHKTRYELHENVMIFYSYRHYPSCAPTLVMVVNGFWIFKKKNKKSGLVLKGQQHSVVKNTRI